jgi:hypothetical protein
MTHPHPSALLSAALAAAGRGWYVFPLLPGQKRPALHGEAACRLTGDCTHGHLKWEERASTDPGRIKICWTSSMANIGIATGPSGLVVIDLDKPKNKGNSSTDAPDGAANFTALCERARQPVPTTYRVRTASGGWHLYFTTPPGIRLANTAGRLAPLIDTRAWGGYVVAAGSTTPQGAYDIADDTPPAVLPGWLAETLTTPHKPAHPHQGARRPLSRDTSAYAAAALRNETANVAGATEGHRNTVLVRAARALGRFVASGDLPRHVVEQALNGAGIDAGLNESECTRAVANALNWSITHNPGRAA